MRALGHTQASWDNLSGQEPQPESFSSPWIYLNPNEKKAALLLGYTQETWDRVSQSEPQPESYYKYWDELTACGESKDPSNMHTHTPSF